MLFVWNLFMTHRRGAEAGERAVEYAQPVRPVLKLPGPLNGFALWNWILAVYMIVDFGAPLLQFFFIETYDATSWGW